LIMQQTRRDFLGRSARGLGSMALMSLLAQSGLGATAGAGDDRWRGIVNPTHFAPKAKRVIYLFMSGGPSHLETFDYKPKLKELNGQPMPESFTKGQQIAQLQGQKLKILAPQHDFARYGASGQEISTAFPHIGSVADDICIIRSMVTEQINHDPAQTCMNTGTSISGRPSIGSWLLYGLGSECENLPGFVVLTSFGGGQNQPIAARQWHSGFLPSRFQGVKFQSSGDAVLYAGRPKGISAGQQRDVLDTVDALDELHNEAVDDPEIAARISQYEMAFNMQSSVPGLMDISKESPKTLEAYGTKGGDGSFAANCLLARRLAERAANGQLDPAAIDEALFASELQTAGEGDPDLLIRTSGEQRISNFLLWQLAYAELHITDVLWPDFDEAALVQALRDYQSRQRRFGGVDAAR